MTEQEMSKLLNCDLVQVREMLATDTQINKGAKPFALTPEQKAVAKKATQSARTAPISVRARKKTELNERKSAIIATFMNAIAEMGGEKLDSKNSEREFTFELAGDKFKVTLAMPRT